MHSLAVVSKGQILHCLTVAQRHTVSFQAVLESMHMQTCCHALSVPGTTTHLIHELGDPQGPVDLLQARGIAVAQERMQLVQQSSLVALAVWIGRRPKQIIQGISKKRPRERLMSAPMCWAGASGDQCSTPRTTKGQNSVLLMVLAEALSFLRV